MSLVPEHFKIFPPECRVQKTNLGSVGLSMIFVIMYIKLHILCIFCAYNSVTEKQITVLFNEILNSTIRMPSASITTNSDDK